VNINFSVTIIGNGSASPHKLRHPSSQYVQIDNEYWLIDCGEGTQFRMLKLGLKRSKLSGIAISHLHGDHYLGLFGLLSSMAMDKRSAPLTIIGPNKLQEMVDIHLHQGGYQ
jgi:ribonuclease Z